MDLWVNGGVAWCEDLPIRTFNIECDRSSHALFEEEDARRETNSVYLARNGGEPGAEAVRQSKQAVGGTS